MTDESVAWFPDGGYVQVTEQSKSTGASTKNICCMCTHALCKGWKLAELPIFPNQPFAHGRRCYTTRASSYFEIIPENHIFIRFIATSNKIAMPLKANGTDNFRDHSGEINQNAVKKNDAHIEKHHTQERTPAIKVSGTMSPSNCIPTRSRSFRNMFPGPASFTNREDIRHIAKPYTIKLVMSMPAFYSKTGGYKTLH